MNPMPEAVFISIKSRASNEAGPALTAYALTGNGFAAAKLTHVEAAPAAVRGASMLAGFAGAIRQALGNTPAVRVLADLLEGRV